MKFKASVALKVRLALELLRLGIAVLRGLIKR